MESRIERTRTSNLNYPMIILFVVTGFLVATSYVYVAKPFYNSTSKIVSPISSATPAGITLFDSPVSVSTEEIKTKPFLTKALENNPGLITTYIECDFKTRPTEYAFPYDIKYSNAGSKTFSAQQYSIKETGTNTFSLISTSYGINRVKHGKFGEEIIDNNLALNITKKVKTPYRTEGLLTTPSYHFKIHSETSKAEELLTNENNLQLSDQHGILTITVQDEHPAAAAAISNAIAEAYIKDRATGKELVSKDNEELETITAQIAETEKEISKYKKDQQLTEIHADTEKNLSMLKELELQKTQLEVQLASLDNLTMYLRKNREINNSQVEYGAIGDPAFAENLSKLNTLYESKASGEASLTNATEIENLKSLISERILNTRKKTAVQIDKVSEIIRDTERSIERIPEQASMLLALERKMQLDKKVYDLMIEKQASAIVDGVTGVSAGKIITPATQPMSPVWPVAYLILAIGAVAGLFAGVLASHLLAAFRKNRIYTRTEISEVTKLPFISTISTSQTSTRNISSSVSNLCTAVLMKSEVKIISIASSNSNEGKTQIAVQLAQGLASIDKKVLLLDINLTSPGITEYFGIAQDQTLSNVLDGSCDIHDAICLTSFPNLEILAPGELSAGVNTLLSSGKKDEVFNTLKKHYDYIIIDTNHSENGIDAAAMMKMSDLNLYVVKANTSKKSSLISAERLKSDYQIKDMYLVLNNITPVKGVGFNSRNRNLSIKVQQNRPEKITFIPGVLKRIALWFY